MIVQLNVTKSALKCTLHLKFQNNIRMTSIIIKLRHRYLPLGQCFLFLIPKGLQIRSSLNFLMHRYKAKNNAFIMKKCSIMTDTLKDNTIPSSENGSGQGMQRWLSEDPGDFRNKATEKANRNNKGSSCLLIHGR